MIDFNNYFSVVDKDGYWKKQGYWLFKMLTALCWIIKNKLSALYHHVNRRDSDGLNPYLNIDEKNKLIIKTPAQDEKETGYVTDILSQQGLVPILQILKDIDGATKMTACFEPRQKIEYIVDLWKIFIDDRKQPFIGTFNDFLHLRVL